MVRVNVKFRHFLTEEKLITKSNKNKMFKNVKVKSKQTVYPRFTRKKFIDRNSKSIWIFQSTNTFTTTISVIMSAQCGPSQMHMEHAHSFCERHIWHLFE